MTCQISSTKLETSNSIRPIRICPDGCSFFGPIDYANFHSGLRSRLMIEQNMLPGKRCRLFALRKAQNS